MGIRYKIKTTKKNKNICVQRHRKKKDKKPNPNRQQRPTMRNRNIDWTSKVNYQAQTGHFNDMIKSRARLNS